MLLFPPFYRWYKKLPSGKRFIGAVFKSFTPPRLRYNVLLYYGIQKAQHLGLENTIAEIWDDGKKAEIELATGEPSLLAELYSSDALFVRN